MDAKYEDCTKNISVYVYMYVCNVCLWVCVCMYVCMYVCGGMHVCTIYCTLAEEKVFYY